MNLFEAKHILQSVGYTVNKDHSDQICAILESISRKVSRKSFLNEMSDRGNARFNKVEGGKGKGNKSDIMYMAGAVEDACSSIDSAGSNYKTGKRTSVPDISRFTELFNDFRTAVDTAIENDEDVDPLIQDTYDKMMNDGFYSAVLNNDVYEIKKQDKGNGAGEKGNLRAAMSNGDIKRALETIKNRIRSGKAKGWGDIAKNNVISDLNALLEMPGAEEYEAQINKCIELASDQATGNIKHRAADTYTAIYDENVKLGVLKALLVKAGVKEAPIVDEENMSITFSASPTVAAKATEILSSRFGMEVVKNERQSAAAAAKETKTIIVDDPEIAEVGLDDDEFAGKYTFGEDGEITLTGTAKQIAKMIAAIEGVGGEIIG